MANLKIVIVGAGIEEAIISGEDLGVFSLPATIYVRVRAVKDIGGSETFSDASNTASDEVEAAP